MNQSLIFLLGLVGGWLICLIGNHHLRERAQKTDFETQLKAYDTIFEGYMDQLTMKQEEIQQEIQEWENNIQRLSRSSESSFRINQAKANQVLELVSQGYNTVEIAQKLGLGVGEVELIKQLKNSEITH
ncbi:MAG TPA: hypothetical protein GX739_05885 [Firmicutes bacterium]|nr:hypothetical protein [Bacillota bacterium]